MAKLITKTDKYKVTNLCHALPCIFHINSRCFVLARFLFVNFDFVSWQNWYISERFIIATNS